MLERRMAVGLPACRDLRHIDEVSDLGFTCGLGEDRRGVDKSRGDGIHKIGSGPPPLERGPNRLKIEQIADDDGRAKVGQLRASLIMLVNKGSDLISLLQQKSSDL